MWKLESRPEASNAMRYASPGIAAVLTLAGGMLVFVLLGKNPIEGFRIFFLNPVRDLNAITELLLKATPLMLIAVGLAVGFRANVWNIGAEGQFLMGAVAATGVALGFQSTESALVLPAMILAGAIGGGFIALFRTASSSRRCRSWPVRARKCSSRYCNTPMVGTVMRPPG